MSASTISWSPLILYSTMTMQILTVQNHQYCLINTTTLSTGPYPYTQHSNIPTGPYNIPNCSRRRVHLINKAGSPPHPPVASLLEEGNFPGCEPRCGHSSTVWVPPQLLQMWE